MNYNLVGMGKPGDLEEGHVPHQAQQLCCVLGSETLQESFQMLLRSCLLISNCWSAFVEIMGTVCCALQINLLMRSGIDVDCRDEETSDASCHPLSVWFHQKETQYF